MNRSQIGLCLLLLLFGLGACRDERQVNIIFILVDDLGWTDLGCYQSSFYETPNIDQLAANGIRFTNAYAASPVCSPTRAAIMTGQSPARVGITDWIPGQDPQDRRLLGTHDLHELPLGKQTIAESLRTEGYRTFFAGKWHLGDEGYFPEDQGFDINLGGHHLGSPPGGYYVPYKNPKLTDGPEGEHLTDRLTSESIEFLESNAGRPFLLFLSYYTVHTPIQAHHRHVKKFQRKAESINLNAPDTTPEHEGRTLEEQTNTDYASMVYALDQNVGRLMAKLAELRLDRNTLVIFTSDNGGLSTLSKNRRLPPTSVRPLRAGKGWCYEGGIRVPLIVKMPAKFPVRAPREIHTPVISMDFFPTILDMAGLDLPPGQVIDGLSLLPLVEGSTLEREQLFWHFPHYHGSAWTPGSAIRKGDWKLVEFYDYEKTELYNLAQDIGEQQNLAAEMPAKVTELKQLLRVALTESGAKLPALNPDFEN